MKENYKVINTHCFKGAEYLIVSNFEYSNEVIHYAATKHNLLKNNFINSIGFWKIKKS